MDLEGFAFWRFGVLRYPKAHLELVVSIFYLLFLFDCMFDANVWNLNVLSVERLT